MGLLRHCGNGRTDCSYENPVITPSEAWLSNWMKCGWMLIFDIWKLLVVVIQPFALQNHNPHSRTRWTE